MRHQHERALLGKPQAAATNTRVKSTYEPSSQCSLPSGEEATARHYTPSGAMGWYSIQNN
jgi:hypothetical protein